MLAHTFFPRCLLFWKLSDILPQSFTLPFQKSWYEVEFKNVRWLVLEQKQSESWGRSVTTSLFTLFRFKLHSYFCLFQIGALNFMQKICMGGESGVTKRIRFKQESGAEFWILLCQHWPDPESFHLYKANKVYQALPDGNYYSN